AVPVPIAHEVRVAGVAVVEADVGGPTVERAAQEPCVAAHDRGPGGCGHLEPRRLHAEPATQVVAGRGHRAGRAAHHGREDAPAPFPKRRTWPAVWATAMSVVACSTEATPPPGGCTVTPPYIWQLVVSQVLAYGQRLSASAYERAATAWARSAFMPAPPPIPPHDAGDSCGTTPRRYDSTSNRLTVRGEPAS